MDRSTGAAYLTGQTASTNFPTVNPVQAKNGGSGDAFVLELNSLGSALVFLLTWVEAAPTKVLASSWTPVATRM